MRYRRDRTAGATYFFTLATWQRLPLFGSPDNVVKLRAAFRLVRTAHPFRIDAMVVLPDHLHCLWTLPSSDDNYPARWNQIKGAFTRSLDESAKPPIGLPQRRERAVWQRRYWEHRIRDDTDFARHCDYIHWNPVKHGLVDSPGNWPYSSFGRFVALRVYPADWGGI
jgi:putative transposase